MALFYSSYAASNKQEEYQLQVQCSKDAKAYFREMDRTRSSGPDKVNNSVNTISDYINHYNRNLNKCFILLSTTTMYDRKSREADYLIQRMLCDINENNCFANINIYRERVYPCEMLGKTCHTEDEWNLLVKPYMEE